MTRRTFLKAATAGLGLSTAVRAQGPNRQVLYNGITLANPWPPSRGEWIGAPERPPYLASPPDVVNIDVGRQLFVDEFLIEESALHRVAHQPVYHDGPVLTPARDWERQDPHADLAGYPRSPSAMVFSDGVFFDPSDRTFKMWYMAGYQHATALALSSDGVTWERPAFDVVRGTNIVSADPRDSSTVWLDPAAADAAARFKMSAFDLDRRHLRLLQSRDGIHWRETGRSGPCGDRSTFFHNPFRNVWAFSLRHDGPLVNRARRYVEVRDFATARWQADDPVSWVGADSLDAPHRSMPGIRSELYNLDAVGYESVMLGLFSLYRGERPDREKPNDLCVAFSRDGFHWSRPDREPFLGVSDRQGDWNWGNVQSAGGCCLIVGDRLHFYVSGRQGVPGTSLPGVCSTGLATLRRDGFVSLTDRGPAGVARTAPAPPGTLTTRPVRFSGGHLFVNAAIDGTLQAEVLDAGGRAIDGFELARSVPARGDGTRIAMAWTGGAALASLAGQPVRFRFALTRASLFAFWVSPSARGESRGYVAAGGPGFSGAIDA